MSKKKLISIIAVILVTVIAVSVIFVVKNKKANVEETTTQNITETTAVEVTTEKSEETTAEKITDAEETETTEKEKLTLSQTTLKKSGVAPDKTKDTYEVLYKKEHIIGIKVKLWGTYLKEIKSSEPVACFSAEYETTSHGEDEWGSYTDYKKQGYDYYFNLKTKKGYRVDWSVLSSEYDVSGETRLLGDGFPEKQKEYDAVEISYEKNCIVMTFWLDKPLKCKNIDADFEISIAENIFGTEFGIGNFNFSDMWFSYAEEE